MLKLQSKVFGVQSRSQTPHHNPFQPDGRGARPSARLPSAPFARQVLFQFCQGGLQSSDDRGTQRPVFTRVRPTVWSGSSHSKKDTVRTDLTSICFGGVSNYFKQEKVKHEACKVSAALLKLHQWTTLHHWARLQWTHRPQRLRLATE